MGQRFENAHALYLGEIRDRTVINRRTHAVVAATANQAMLTDRDKDQIRQSVHALVR